MKLSLSSMTKTELAETLGLKPFQGRQLFQWLHQKRVFDFDAMTNLSKALRAQLAETASASQLELVEMQESKATGTKKALFRLHDGETVESVLIRDRKRTTICVSSQLGCALKCSFCATGLAGFTRNLTPGEIVEQVLYLLQDEADSDRTPNIVYMGMGEPMRNYDNVMASIRLLMDKDGVGIGARKIIVSTVGEAKEIERFTQEDWQVRLSVSLHAANNELRSTLVPLNRKFPLERLHDVLSGYSAQSGRQLTFEWTMLKGVNDSVECARELVAYAKGLKVSVNLIPWNPVSGLPYHPTHMADCNRFRDILEAGGLKVTVRMEKGQDIDAACGQLSRTHGKA
ncbi:MAG: 23S rRNA (adenine(2503)-C(2))-methyltransferase RlmN [Candidatus Hydrogenedentes bacterium]|nr:23S rRNA (adenine(2503)-C(2))-methyltransferase RlmN [Candidatus Hydrogenedentota bacterium]